MGREKAAHDLAIATASYKDADILIVAEPHIAKARHKGWVTDVRSDVAVFFLNRRLMVRQVVFRNGLLGIYFRGYWIVSCYVWGVRPSGGL